MLLLCPYDIDICGQLIWLIIVPTLLLGPPDIVACIFLLHIIIIAYLTLALFAYIALLHTLLHSLDHNDLRHN